MNTEAVYRNIDTLVQYAVFEELIPESEKWYATNQILDLLGMESFDCKLQPSESLIKKFYDDAGSALMEILDSLCDAAAENGKIDNLGPYREIFSTKLMNVFSLRPQQLVDKFWEEYRNHGEQQAMCFLSDYMTKINYLNSYRLNQDLRWSFDSKYGRLEILVSLTKPELDPQAILAAKLAPINHYPFCALCRENEGYAGRINAAARATHRVIPLTIRGKKWFLQLSPYKYLDQHCILLTEKHYPMCINREKIETLTDFLDMFPSLFLGSNADLPFVGGSVLAHEHFQGGHHHLPIMSAKVREVVSVTDEISVSILNWPLSTICLTSKNKELFIEQAASIIDKWHVYSNAEQKIDCGSEENFHNTITPIGWKDPKQGYILCLMLRNNVTTEERPDGLYHTHPSRFHIKKEGIGIIDAPGLSIFPPRLKKEFTHIAEILLNRTTMEEHPELSAHFEWVERMKNQYIFTEENVWPILHQEVGDIFVQMLEDCAVFDNTEQGEKAFLEFVKSCMII